MTAVRSSCRADGHALALPPAQGGSAAARRGYAARVPFAAVVRQPLGTGINVNGRLVAREEAAVSSQLSGYLVARVLVDQDALVRAGQPLAELDATLLRSDIAQNRAASAQSRVAADKADQEASRVTSLDHTGVLSDEAIAQRRLAARTAHAQVDQSQAQLSAQLVKQGLMVVRAPVAGRILSRSVRPGDVASPSSVMFTMARDDRAELDAEIPEAAGRHPCGRPCAGTVGIGSLGRWHGAPCRGAGGCPDPPGPRAHPLARGSRNPPRRLCPRRIGRKACAGAGRSGGGGLL
jgi:multidrug efflux pump subunit AcrA (membrane-fusion protein)